MSPISFNFDHCDFLMRLAILRYNNSMIGIYLRFNHTVNTIQLVICTANFKSVTESVSQCPVLLTSSRLFFANILIFFKTLGGHY